MTHRNAPVLVHAFLFLPLVAGLSGCGDNLAGTTYSGQGALSKMTFKKNGKAEMTNFAGTVMEVSYERDEEKLKIITPQGAQIWKFTD